METMWAYPWFIWVGGLDFVDWPEPPITLASALFLPVAAILVSRTAIARRWPVARILLVGLPALLLLTALVVRLEVGGGLPLWDSDWLSYAGEQRGGHYRQSRAWGLPPVAGTYHWDGDADL